MAERLKPVQIVLITASLAAVGGGVLYVMKRKKAPEAHRDRRGAHRAHPARPAHAPTAAPGGVPSAIAPAPAMIQPPIPSGWPLHPHHVLPAPGTLQSYAPAPAPAYAPTPTQPLRHHRPMADEGGFADAPQRLDRWYRHMQRQIPDLPGGVAPIAHAHPHAQPYYPSQPDMGPQLDHPHRPHHEAIPAPPLGSPPPTSPTHPHQGVHIEPPPSAEIHHDPESVHMPAGPRGPTYWYDLIQHMAIIHPGTQPQVTISDLQQYLNKLAPATNLKIDGILGDRTIAALQAFQSAHGLPVTGHLDRETSSALLYAVMLQHIPGGY
jgi:hypothetical protein